MDEVMVYIRNIPLDRNNQIMAELIVMESIREEAQRFNDMKINMSVKEIMDEGDLVVGKIIAYELEKRGLRKMTDW